uniref:Uncharacterized protein n=1 Tax=Podoviridae sp. ctcKt3 TaxID=2826566 RepID=A0A8S5N6V4_9CAUD|nr:MAG TPA: hypothetical protein [Podoviridae sp. ctcKt3]
MIIKMDYFNDDNIVDLFNSLLPDNYFTYRTGLTDIRGSLVGESECFIPVRFCRKHKGVMKCIDGDIHAAFVRIHGEVVELEWMRLNIDVLQWKGESDPLHLDVKFAEFRDFDKLKHTVSYDAKCLAKGCPTVTMEVKDVENEKQ